MDFVVLLSTVYICSIVQDTMIKNMPVLKSKRADIRNTDGLRNIA